MSRFQFLASIARTGEERIWRIVYIDEGEAEGRGWIVGREALEASLPLFENVWVQSLRFDSHYDHLHGDARAVFPEGVISGNIIGLGSNPNLEQIDGKWAITGTMRTASDKADKLLMLAAEAGRLGDFGLSVNAETDPEHAQKRPDGKLDVSQFDRVFSVDLVTYPARGGGVRELLASAGFEKQRGKGGFTMTFVQRLKKVLDARQARYDADAASPLELLASVEAEAVAQPGLKEMLEAIIAALKGGLDDLADSVLAGMEKSMSASAPKDGGKKEDEGGKKEELLASLPQGTDAETKALLQKVLTRLDGIESQQQTIVVGGRMQALPEGVRTLLASRGASVADVDLAAALVDALGVDDSGHVALPGGSRASIGLNTQDKLRIAAYKMMGSIATDAEKSEWQGVPEVRSIRELYIRCTGDVHLEAYKHSPRPGRSGVPLQASNGLFQPTDFPYLMGDSLSRTVVDIYREEEKSYQQYVTYRKNVTDFRDIKINRIGGMGLLPRFEDAPDGTGIVKRAVPGEQQGSYRIEIYSDKVVFSFKFIKDDDMDAFNIFKRDYATSCIDTVNFHCGAGLVGATVVYDAQGNASVQSINTRTIYDGDVLYSEAHKNLLKKPISYQQIQRGMQMIRLQKRAGTNRSLRKQPWGLWYPIELSPTVNTIIDANGEPNTNSNNPNNVATLQRIELPVEDIGGNPNNWGVITDPKKLAVVQLAFLEDQESPWITTTTPNQTAGAPWDFLRTEFRGVMMFGVGIQAHEAGVMSVVPE